MKKFLSILVALCMLTAYAVAESPAYQAGTYEAVAAGFGGDVKVTMTFEDGKINYPTFGEEYAVLTAESIGLTVGVYYGVNADLLDRGACQSTQSAIIGEKGNTVIDAHVKTYFSDLSKLKTGDTVELYTDYGSFTYKVTETIRFDKNDKRWLAVTKEPYLTLYTCAPQVIGSADMRVGVRCEPVSMKFYAPADEQ